MNFSKGNSSYIEQGKENSKALAARRQEMREKKFDTIAVHGVYDTQSALANQGSIIEPIFLSTSEAFENSNHLETAFAYQIPAWGYTRMANPSVTFLEETLALLEGYQLSEELTATVTSSGMAAVFMATNPFLERKTGEKINIVASARCYGGSFMLFSERYQKEQDIEIRWVQDPLDTNEWANKIDDGTRFVYGEMPSNPQLSVFDIDSISKLAHQADIPMIVDSTLATPALMRPIQFGADIVIHSVSKSMTKSGFSIAGALISKQNIPSKVGTNEMKENFAQYVKLHPARDFGSSLSPFNAIMTLNDLRTLRSTIHQMSTSALKIAQFLESHPQIESVNYPGLESSEAHSLAKKYLKLVDSEEITGDAMNCFGHLLSFCVKGNAESTRKVIDSFKFIPIATDLGRVKSIATIPAISTHQQQGCAGRDLAHIPDNMIRLSVGLENTTDLIKELDQALKQS